MKNLVLVLPLVGLSLLSCRDEHQDVVSDNISKVIPVPETKPVEKAKLLKEIKVKKDAGETVLKVAYDENKLLELKSDEYSAKFSYNDKNQITTIVETDKGVNTTYEFEYDRDNKISNFRKILSNNRQRISVTHEKNKVFGTFKGNNGKIESITLTLDDNKLVKNVEQQGKPTLVFNYDTKFSPTKNAVGLENISLIAYLVDFYKGKNLGSLLSLLGNKNILNIEEEKVDQNNKTILKNIYKYGDDNFPTGLDSTQNLEGKITKHFYEFLY